MSKFKVGDRVRVKRPVDVDVFPCWVSKMDPFDGLELTVSSMWADHGHFLFDADGVAYEFNEDWAELSDAAKGEPVPLGPLPPYEDPTTLTRRDRFAMAALTGILPGCSGLSKDEFLTVAGVAYDFADAMELARNKDGGSE